MTDIADWITAVGSLLSGAGITGGVLVAYRQLGIWKDQALAQKRADVAINLFATANEVGFALNAVRQALERIPEEAKDRNLAILEQKHERLRSFQSEFDSLRKLQVQAKALFKSESINKSISDIFSIRQEVWAAIGTLANKAEGDSDFPEMREFYSKLSWSLYRTDGERDELSKRQDAALRTLEEELIPYIRLSGATK